MISGAFLFGALKGAAAEHTGLYILPNNPVKMTSALLGVLLPHAQQSDVCWRCMIGPEILPGPGFVFSHLTRLNIEYRAAATWSRTHAGVSDRSAAPGLLVQSLVSDSTFTSGVAQICSNWSFLLAFGPHSSSSSHLPGVPAAAVWADHV